MFKNTSLKLTNTVAAACLIAIGLSGITACQAKPTAEQKQALKSLVQKSLSNMTQVPGGTYLMGASDKRFMTFNNTPAHKVHLTSFYISKYNTDYQLYDLFTIANNFEQLQKDNLGNFFRNFNYPVNFINWHQANNYCEFLAKKTGLPYSLPTEAQWEYVARNNGKLHWHFATNNGKQELGKNFPSFNMLTHQKGNYGGAPMPLRVGSIPCTPQGICGLNGQVNQWVKDWYAPHYYSHSPVNNPEGPKTGTQRVIRGGGAGGSPVFNNNLGRVGVLPNKTNGGFRCVINSTLSKKQLMKIAMK